MAQKSKYVEVDFGTGTLTREQRLSALEEIGAKSRSMHAETRQKLIDLLEANDAIEILARMGLRFVFTGGGWNTKQHVPAGHQHHLEMLHAFALRKPRKTGATDN